MLKVGFFFVVLFFAYVVSVVVLTLVLFAQEQTTPRSELELQKSLGDAFAQVPIVIHTCAKFRRDALACEQRLRSYGLGTAPGSITHVDGDQDPRIDLDKVYRKNRSFLSTCLTMVEQGQAMVLAVEEDTELWRRDFTFETRLQASIQTLNYAKAHPQSWELCYLACLAINPIGLRVSKFTATSAKGQLGGHAMLISLKAAQRYVNDISNRQCAFDSWWAKQSVKTILATPPAFFQNKTPDTMVNRGIPGEFAGYQDLSHALWPIVWDTVAFSGVAIIGGPLVYWFGDKVRP